MLHSDVVYSLWNSLKKGPLKIFVIGGGNWGTVSARIVAQNAATSHIFDEKVYMWIHEEHYEGKTLTEIINKDHENPKYLPNYKLPENLIATTELIERASEADLIIFVIPHQFVEDICKRLKGKIKYTAQAISLVKGIKVENGNPTLYSSVIENALQVPCSVLSGANVANDIAQEQFCETTIGYHPKNLVNAFIWQELFDKPYFKTSGVPDIAGVEICGALKNIIALSVGFAEALKCGTNTKAALIRIGVEEIKLFTKVFFTDIKEDTFFDSAGYADVITTCFGGRNFRCAVEFAKRKGKDSWESIEKDMLNGQKLQGQLTCKEVYGILVKYDLKNHFPLFTTTYKISFENLPVEEIINAFKSSALKPFKNANECNACLISKEIKNFKATVLNNTDHS